MIWEGFAPITINHSSLLSFCETFFLFIAPFFPSRHYGSEQRGIETKVLGHSLVPSLICLHRSLICLLCPACFVCTLPCVHSYACSLTHHQACGKVNVSVLCCSEPKCTVSNFVSLSFHSLCLSVHWLKKDHSRTDTKNSLTNQYLCKLWKVNNWLMSIERYSPQISIDELISFPKHF